MSNTAPPIPPPVVALTSLAVQVALTRRAGGRRRFPGQRALAAGLATAAAVSSSVAARRLVTRGTTLDPMHPDQASALSTDGIFARTRNPMYLGLATLLTGTAVATGHLRSLLPVAAFVAWVDRLQIPAEEAALAQRFGVEYDAYRARTPRWL